MAQNDRLPLPMQLAWPAFVGGVVALVGTYWDDAWHTDRGRDSFFIAPHLTLYGGVLLAAIAVGVWLLLAAREAGPVRAVRRDPPLRWAALGAGAVFVSAPIDEMWHTAYGRDAVLFSPPHLLAIVASATLIVALAGGLGPPAQPLGGWSRALRSAAAAGVLGAMLVPVMEYEADVPQFSPAWFLPIVTAALVVARPVAAMLLGGRWPLTRAAAIYTVGRLLLVAALAGTGFSTPIMPPVVFVALVADGAAARRWSWPVQAVAVALSVHVAYVPWLAVVPHGVRVEDRDLAVSIGVAVAAAVAAHVALRPGRKTHHVPVMGAAALVVAMSGAVGVARPASAHDPGQGEQRGEAELSATVDDRTVQLEAAISDADCAALEEPTVVARRAGMTRSASMTRRAGCAFAGSVRVPDDGRWFVYATFRTREGALEAWMPVEVAAGSQTSSSRVLYQPPSRPDRASQVVAGVALVLAAAVLLGGSLRSIAAFQEPDAALPPITT